MTEADRERLKTDPVYRLEYIMGRWAPLLQQLADGDCEPKDGEDLNGMRIVSTDSRLRGLIEIDSESVSATTDPDEVYSLDVVGQVQPDPSTMTAAQRREECARLGQQIKALHEQVGQLRDRVRLLVQAEMKGVGNE